MVILLRDTTSSNVDAVIITRTTDKDEIQDIIDEVKEKWGEDDYPDDLFSLVVDALPDDCEVYAAWASDFNTVWY